jgi:uncharacterized protein YbdZ (MbtH family)
MEEVGAIEVRRKDAASARQLAFAASSVAGPRAALPAGWEAVESADGTYYSHDASGVTQWERPTGDAAVVDAGEALPEGWSAVESAEGTYFAHESGQTQWERPDDLPPGWTAAFSRSRQLPYWRHTSGESVWEKPKK